MSFGWARRHDGRTAHRRRLSHDGMAAFRWLEDGYQTVRLVRNHEVGAGTPFSGAAYDPGAAAERRRSNSIRTGARSLGASTA